MEKIKLKKHHLLLAGIMVLSFLLNFLFIEKAGEGNVYYTAAVKSMLTGFDNFFYASFDSGGFVTVDKPPLGLWIQALSAAVFGVSGWSVILPQALAGAFSAFILYLLVRRYFGKTAGLLAALILAVTPILVATSRTNNLDSLLLLCTLLATWFIQKAVDTSRFKWLFFSALLVGLGFNIKMMQAFLILPAFFLFYLLGANRKRKLLKLSGAFAVLILVAFSWGTIVDITPAEKRPYVGSSMNNSVMELAVGYNGILRVLPTFITGKLLQKLPALGGMPAGALSSTKDELSATQEAGRANMMSSPLGLMGTMENGDPGLLRLFNKKVGGQISWLFVLALFAFPAVIFSLKKEERNLKNPQLTNLVLWGLWLFSMFCYFSISGFFHRYYLVMLAPALAALAGIALSRLWDLYKNKHKAGFLLPVALLLNLGLQIVLLAAYPAWGNVLIPLITFFVILSAGILFAGWLRTAPLRITPLLPAAAAAAMAVLLLAPFTWALTPMLFGGEPTIPSAGPELAVTDDPLSINYLMQQEKKLINSINLDKVVGFLEKHKGNEKFLVSVPNAPLAAPLILRTNDAVMATGGFAGIDHILTVDRLSRMAAHGDIRYMLVVDMAALLKNASSLFPVDAFGDFEVPAEIMDYFTQKALSDWIASHGTVVPKDEWFQWKGSPDLAFQESLKNLDDAFRLYDLKPGA